MGDWLGCVYTTRFCCGRLVLKPQSQKRISDITQVVAKQTETPEGGRERSGVLARGGWSLGVFLACLGPSVRSFE